jgi:hypothetical protein
MTTVLRTLTNLEIEVIGSFFFSSTLGYKALIAR